MSVITTWAFIDPDRVALDADVGRLAQNGVRGTEGDHIGGHHQTGNYVVKQHVGQGRNID